MYIFGVYLWCVALMYIFGVYLWCISLLYIFGVYLWCISLLCIFGVYLCPPGGGLFARLAGSQVMEMEPKVRKATLRHMYVWMRYSATRALTWQRSYNTQPRQLTGAQDGLSMCLAGAHK